MRKNNAIPVECKCAIKTNVPSRCEPQDKHFLIFSPLSLDSLLYFIIFIRSVDKLSRNFGAVNVTMISMKNLFIPNDGVWYQFSHSAEYQYLVLENTPASGVACQKFREGDQNLFHCCIFPVSRYLIMIVTFEWSRYTNYLRYWENLILWFEYLKCC